MPSTIYGCTISEIMLLVYFTLYHVMTDNGNITSYAASVLGYNYHIHPGGFFDLHTHLIEARKVNTKMLS